MRKTTDILLSPLLSTMIVWIGSGIMTVVCVHTGNVSVAKMEDKGHCNDNGVKNCMKIEVKTLSPTDMVHNDFYHIQPIQLSLLPQFVSDCQLLPLPVLTKAPERILSLLWHSPPRQYLRLLTTLIIWFLVVFCSSWNGQQKVYRTCYTIVFRQKSVSVCLPFWYHISFINFTKQLNIKQNE